MDNVIFGILELPVFATQGAPGNNTSLKILKLINSVDYDSVLLIIVEVDLEHNASGTLV